MPSLPVDLNVDRLHDLEVPESFAAAATFTVELRNHGEAVHVHLHLDDDLSQVARLGATNNYVEPGETRPVEVAVRNVDEPVTGKLKVVTAYGAETEYVDLTVEPPVEEDEQVAVDESLGVPATPEPATAPADRLREALAGSSAPVLALGAFAVLLAVAVSLLAGSPAVTLAAAVVVAGVLAALAFLLR